METVINIKALRSKLGISQEELASNTGLSLRTIQRIENGETIPRGDSLQRIAKALGVTVQELNSVASNENQQAASKEEERIVRLVTILAFGYLIHPLLAIVFPAVIWFIYKDSGNNIRSAASRVMRQQFIWCLVLFTVYLYVFIVKILHWNLPVPRNTKSIMWMIVWLYIVNAFIIFRNIARWFPVKRFMKKRYELQNVN